MSELLSFLCKNVPQFRISRLAALYSDFDHLRLTNPEGYTANISAWLQGLAAAARAGVIQTINKEPGLLSLSVDEELVKALESEYGRPLSLGTVVREGIQKGRLISRQEFMEAFSCNHSRSWTLRPWEILIYTLKRFRLSYSSNGESVFPVGEFIILENLEAAAGEVKKKFSKFQAKSERVFTRETFAENLGLLFDSKVSLSDSDLEVLLKFLARDVAFISYNSEIVKLRLPNQTDIITSEDVNIASIKKLIKEISNQIKALNQKYDELSASAKVAVSKKNRVGAIAALKSRSLTNQTLEKRYAALGKLEEILLKVEQASDQLELVKVMKGGIEVLEELNKEVLAFREDDNLFDELQHQMESANEVSILTRFESIGDDSNLDDELKILEQEEKTKLRDLETKSKLDVLKEMDFQSLEAKLNPLTASELQRELDHSTELLKNVSLVSDT